jgi:hypothetical protein
MAERKKLELELNKPVSLELLFDEPMVGQSRYGEYFLYAVKNGTDTEYSFFAPDDVHEKLKEMHKGDRFEITKTAEQKGSKIVTKHEVKLLAQPTQPNPSNNNIQKDSYFEAMLSSYRDALKIQDELNGMVDVNRIAITLFIARSKINGNGYS